MELWHSHTVANEARPSTSKATLGRILRGLIDVLLVLLLTIALLLVSLPVPLLFIGTSVPAMIRIGLVLADVVFVVMLLRVKHSRLFTIGGIFGIVGISMLAIWLSQIYASTPPITDEHGGPLPGSIASLEEVNLNGTQQWISLRGKDVSKPVLLFLGIGGPGAGGFAIRSLFAPLEDHFVIASWDEPGTGKSYYARPIRSLTPERYIEDAHALTLLLRERFHQDKIYLYGVSWTSILGIWLVQRYPELYYAYIANGQMVNTKQDDLMGYDFAIKYAAEHDDTATAEMLRRNGPPPYTGDGLVMKYVAYMDVLNDYMGAPRYVVIAPLIPMFASEYGLLDKVNHFRGLYETFEAVYPQLQEVNFMTQATKLDVPVYFLAGRQDVNAMSSLVEGYYNVLQAPHKDLIWVENAGHSANDAMQNRLVDVMVNTVLPQTRH